MVEYARSGQFLKQLGRLASLILILALLFLGAYYGGFTRTYCAEDQNCFREKAESCAPAEVYLSRENNIYYYNMKPSITGSCAITITFERAQEGTSPEHQFLLEGKSMTCNIEKNKLRDINVLEVNDLMEYCHGPLKEALYELIIKRMYELVIVNLGEITEETEKLLEV